MKGNKLFAALLYTFYFQSFWYIDWKVRHYLSEDIYYYVERLKFFIDIDQFDRLVNNNDILIHNIYYSMMNDDVDK